MGCQEWTHKWKQSDTQIYTDTEGQSGDENGDGQSEMSVRESRSIKSDD